MRAFLPVLIIMGVMLYLVIGSALAEEMTDGRGPLLAKLAIAVAWPLVVAIWFVGVLLVYALALVAWILNRAIRALGAR